MKVSVTRSLTKVFCKRISTNAVRRLWRHDDKPLNSDKALTAPKMRYCELTERSIVRLTGPDALNFLQGLLTNDVSYLGDGQKSQYALMLNTSGRILFDLIVYNCAADGESPDLLLECDGKRFSELLQTLVRYKMRKKLDMISCKDSMKVYALFPWFGTGLDPTNEIFPEDVLPTLIASDWQPVSWCADPRCKSLGSRLVLPVEEDPSFYLGSAEKTDLSHYQMTRYMLGVAENSEEILPGKSLPLESNGDYLNGVSFHKGCYIGQELTARSHHTGVIRKRIMPLRLLDSVDAGKLDLVKGESKILVQNSENVVGRLRGFRELYGLGLMRVDEALNSSNNLCIEIGENEKYRLPCKTWRPVWWGDSEVTGEVRGYQPPTEDN